MEFFFGDFASDVSDFDAADVTHTKTIIQMTTTYFHLTMHPIVKYVIFGRHGTLRLRYRNL